MVLKIQGKRSLKDVESGRDKLKPLTSKSASIALKLGNPMFGSKCTWSRGIKVRKKADNLSAVNSLLFISENASSRGTYMLPVALCSECGST